MLRRVPLLIAWVVMGLRMSVGRDGLWTTRMNQNGNSPRASKLALLLLWGQGLYYFVTGVWPLVSIRTFQMVTGPKTDHLPTGRESDHWLVMTVGVLITAVSLAILYSAWKKRVSTEIGILGIASAIGLTAIDIIYVSRGVIDEIYLLDAAAEVPIILGWLWILAERSSSRSKRRSVEPNPADLRRGDAKLSG